LGRDRPADQGRKLRGTDGEVLLDLDNPDFIAAAFGLHRQHVVRAAPVQAQGSDLRPRSSDF